MVIQLVVLILVIVCNKSWSATTTPAHITETSLSATDMHSALSTSSAGKANNPHNQVLTIFLCLHILLHEGRPIGCQSNDIVVTWPSFMEFLQVAEDLWPFYKLVICFALLIVSCHECQHTTQCAHRCSVCVDALMLHDCDISVLALLQS